MTLLIVFFPKQCNFYVYIMKIKNKYKIHQRHQIFYCKSDILPKICWEQVDQDAEHKTDGERGEGFEDTGQYQVLGGVLYEVQTDGYHTGETE